MIRAWVGRRPGLRDDWRPERSRARSRPVVSSELAPRDLKSDVPPYQIAFEQMSDAAPHALLHYTVDGLLDRGRLELDLAVGDATILTGANGTGKSTVLRTLDRFARGAWDSLRKLPFKAMTLEFDAAKPVHIARKDDTLE